MNKVVVSADGGWAGKAAIEWCIEHLRPGATVVAVCGLNQSSEFAFGVEPGAMYPAWVAQEREFRDRRCLPLRLAGFVCDYRFVRASQLVALREVAKAERPDALIIGKRGHSAILDAVLADPAHRLAHRPPCPLIVVPVDPDQGHRSSSVGEEGRSRLALLAREGDTIVLDVFVSAVPPEPTTTCSPGIPGTIRVNVPQRQGATAEIEATLRSWLETGQLIGVSFRKRLGARLVDLRDEDTVLTLPVEQAPQFH